MSAPAPNRRGSGPRARGPDRRRRPGSRARSAARRGAHVAMRQPRRRADPEGIAELAESVRVQGIVQPVVVRPLEDGRCRLVAGERRWQAARLAGLATVPAIVGGDDATRFSSPSSRTSRGRISPVEEARVRRASGRVRAQPRGRGRARRPVEAGGLEPPSAARPAGRRARALGGASSPRARSRVLAVPDHEGRRRLARRIVRQGMSVRAAERAARRAGARTKPRRPAGGSRTCGPRTRRLELVTGAEARVGKGKLEVFFESETQLEEIVESLQGRYNPTPRSG